MHRLLRLKKKEQMICEQKVIKGNFIFRFCFKAILGDTQVNMSNS